MASCNAANCNKPGTFSVRTKNGTVTLCGMHENAVKSRKVVVDSSGSPIRA